MDHVLAVDVVQGEGDLGADRGDLVRRQRRLFQQATSREVSGDEFHHDVRLLEIAGGDETRHMRAR